MAPRKTTKTPLEVNPEALTPAPKAAKAPARPRAKKTPVEAITVAPEAPVAVADPSVAEAPVKAARKGRTPAAKAAAPAPALETPDAPQVAVPSRTDVADLITDQAKAVLGAIQDGRAVELIFADADSNPPRTFEPRQLIFDAFAKGWYVWGWDRRYNAERHHLLSLIAQVNKVEGMGRAAQGPYKEGTAANLIGGWLGGEAIRVKAVLLKQWIFAVRQAPAPFPEFKLEDLEEGKAQVSFLATDLRAIARWVMQFGDGIQILEPQRLVDRIKQVGVTWGGKPAVAATPAPAAASRPAQSRSEHREHREHKSEHRNEHRSEHRSETKPEQGSERKRPEPSRHVREAQESPKPAKPAKVEIRFDRL